MNWRRVGNVGEPYPAWVRELKGKSGVYAIREVGWLGGRTVVYVGESHTNNLYGTLTRHFQKWARWKRPPKTIADWWAKARVFTEEQTDPGHTYKRAAVEVAIRTSSSSRATSLQHDWIARLKPRDNVADVEEVPF